MLTIEKNFETFFSFIDNEEKQKRFNSLLKEKNLSLDDLDLIFQTVKPKQNVINPEMTQIKSVEVRNAIVVEINKGLGTKESPVMRSYLWWSESGLYIGETLSPSCALTATSAFIDKGR